MCSKLTVEPVLFLFMLAIFMQFTVFQDMIYETVCENKFTTFVCNDLHNVKNRDKLEEVLDESSRWLMWSGVSFAIPSIMATNFLGSWGDSYGRKFPLYLPSLGTSVGTLIYVIVSVFKCTNLPWIIVGSAISGVTGGFVGCIMTVTSYTTEVANNATRTSRVSLLESSTFIAAALGPILGASVSGAANRNAVFGACLLCHALLVVYVFIFVHDTERSQSSPSNIRWKELIGLNHLLGSIKTSFKEREGGKRTNIMFLFVSALIIMTATEGEISQTFVYVHEDPPGWSLNRFGIYFAMRSGIACLPLLFVGWLQPREDEHPCLRLPLPEDHNICSIGLLSKIAGLILLGFSSSTIPLFLVPVVSLLGYLCIPTLRSLLSKQVEADELGKIFSFLAMLQNLCTLLGSIIFNGLYPLTRHIFRGMVFEIGAVILIIPLIIMLSSRWNNAPVNYLNVQSVESGEDDG
ncbi:proton-coupled folate transporter-like [Hetaerina americana]|uniref:proton-coupled folate transporter-like n=1 Tax=Hetaerina americana TaxID=62018 RepID=UPI003A7F375B